MGRSRYSGRWQEIVHRSALVLKLLVSDTHGSLIAAATCSLPEELGGVRNWDYRYTWIRDASFTLYALIRLGYTEEAGAFMHWIADRCMELNPDGSMQIMYGYDGRKVLTEQTLPHLEGYRGSAPVRIGNGAFDQLQLDIYGELMDAVYLHNKYGELISADLWDNLIRLVNYVCDNWHRPDEGIWEVRGGQQEFLYSRLMCWVAVDRGIRLADRRSLPYPRARASAGTGRVTRSTGRSSPSTSTLRVRHSYNTRAQRLSTRRTCSCRSYALSARPTRSGAPRSGRWRRNWSTTRWSTAINRAPAPPTAYTARRAPSPCAPSGTAKYSPAPEIPKKLGSCSRRCWATQTTSASTPRSSARTANTSATSHRHSPTSA
ncbi:MAG: glycosyl hydrolase, glycosyl hydrolase family 15 [Thermomicrobiales bacterium]|nr:glycosyl hydrolase, glycosyl hydrolase family 15 [Thermomicrobiales bacterium]